MTDTRIQACIYEGAHQPETDGVRHPISPVIAYDMPAPVDRPGFTPYYLIYRCHACNMEWRETYDRTGLRT
jgi:hypothetical protein